MRAQLAILVLVGAVSTTSAGQLMDENTRELTNRGAIVSMFASAQVSEMRCSLKGQITKALNDKNRLFGRAVLRDGDCRDRKKDRMGTIGARAIGIRLHRCSKSNDHRDEAP
jgi:hypothetical protein